jgi:serine/threonine-protein kinase
MSAAPSSTEPRLPQPGDRIAERYVVESRLATGGMGVVVVARHELLGESFAIKVLKPDLMGTHDVSRFLREAQSCVGLRGEHTVRVFDVGTLPSGLPFMVMELLDGHDLRRELEQRGALPIDEATTWVTEACHALAEAHARGIVHRDIKPGNLFLALQPDGRRIVKVVDFGISKLLDEPISDESPRLTQTLGLLGSPQYMSPEQVRSASQVDHRSDIWSLGCVLYELLTGVPAFAGESVSSVSAKIVVDEPTPLETLRPSLPQGLIFATMRCLSKDRAERIQSVAELAELLEPYALGAPGASERVLNILRAGGAPSSSRRASRVSLSGVSEAETLSNVAPVSTARRLAARDASLQPGNQPLARVDVGEPAARGRRALVGVVSMATCIALGIGVFVGLRVNARSQAESLEPAPRAAMPPVTTEAEKRESRRRIPPEGLAPVTLATSTPVSRQTDGPRVGASAVPANRVVTPNSGGSTRPTDPTAGDGQAPVDPKPATLGQKELNDVLSDRH